MSNFLTWLARRRYRYDPLITVEISRNRLLNNLNEFRKLAPAGTIAPVLKSNAYGHGLYEVAAILEHDHRIPFLVVDSYFEALALRSANIRKPILIIGYTRPEIIEKGHLRNVSFTISSLEALQAIEDTDRRIQIHLKIDTGMHRQGIMPDEIDRAADLIAENSFIELRGVCSHLADADNPDPSFTEAQINIWNRCIKKFKSQFATLRYIHVSATDGHRYADLIDANVSRLGLGLYGLIEGTTFDPHLDIKPALEMKTSITGIKKVVRDDVIGYGGTYKAKQALTIATIPVGYYEGLDRRLSSNGYIGVNHSAVPCPIVGRVSMNITSIDITGVSDIKIGTSVTVISRNTGDTNSIVSMAKRCRTIPYEIAVHIPAHLKRVVVE